MAKIPQVRRLAFNDEAIGMGFDSESGLAVGTALQDFGISENAAANGAEVIASISIVNSHEELQEKIGMAFEAQGRYGFISASAKARFAEQTNYNSTSTFVVASITVKNALKRGINFKLTPDAQALVTSNRMEEFRNAFGDSFVRGLQTGGEFHAVIRITSTSTKTQKDLALDLQAEANGLLASGSFKASYQQANTEESTRSEFFATMYQRAGANDTISPTVSIEEVMTRYKQFPRIAAEHAAAYETEVATYDTIPLPLQTPEERDSFVLALADARERKLRYIQLRNDLEFALRNPSFFEGLPPEATIKATLEAYTKLLNGVTAHAIKIARGTIEPQFFDPSLLVPPVAEPQGIPLVRTGNKVQIFTHSDYAPMWNGIPGRTQKLSVGRYDDSRGEILIGNDQLSSLLVPEGLAVRVYDHAWFQGAFIDFTTDTPAVPMDWNDRASSIIVYRADEAPPIIDYVVALDFAWSRPAQLLKVGKYVDLTTTVIGAGKLSALLIPNGLGVRLWDRVGLAGQSVTLVSDTLQLPPEWDNRAASLEVLDFRADQ